MPSPTPRPGRGGPAGVVWGIVWSRLQRPQATELAVELRTEAADMRARLARALGDPTLELAYRLDDGRYVDAAGHAIELPRRDRRAVTALTSGGEEIAVLVQDPALLDEPGLVESVRATAGLVLENERLAAQVRSQSSRCARRAPGSSRPATPSGAGSSATSTTVRSRRLLRRRPADRHERACPRLRAGGGRPSRVRPPHRAQPLERALAGDRLGAEAVGDRRPRLPAGPLERRVPRRRVAPLQVEPRRGVRRGLPSLTGPARLALIGDDGRSIRPTGHRGRSLAYQVCGERSVTLRVTPRDGTTRVGLRVTTP